MSTHFSIGWLLKRVVNKCRNTLQQGLHEEEIIDAYLKARRSKLQDIAKDGDMRAFAFWILLRIARIELTRNDELAQMVCDEMITSLQNVAGVARGWHPSNDISTN